MTKQFDICPFCGREKVEWISVKDRLPKDDEFVLVVEEGQIIIAVYDAILDGFFENDDGLSLLIDIEVCPTHWMPLPLPPKDGE